MNGKLREKGLNQVTWNRINFGGHQAYL